MPSKPKVRFEKTAGARATRSNNPTVLRGLSTSTGFAMMGLGLTLSAAVFAMGTIDLADELSKPDGSLSAALAKPSTVDPKSQAEAYNLDKPGWMASEDKELKNHADNGSWEYIDASELPRAPHSRPPTSSDNWGAASHLQKTLGLSRHFWPLRQWQRNSGAAGNGCSIIH